MGEPLLLRSHEIGALTDRQILDLYFHPRDEEGQVVMPVDPVTIDYMNEEAQVRGMASSLGIPKEKIQEVIARARAKRGTNGP